MKKLLIPLIILLLIIGFFMSRERREQAEDAHNTLDQPSSETTENSQNKASPNGDTMKGATEDASESLKDVGKEVRDTAESAVNKIRGEKKSEDSSNTQNGDDSNNTQNANGSNDTQDGDDNSNTQNGNGSNGTNQ
ncbi:MAG: hypothetical protein K0U59_05080 [Gammaproteobacteria bacterium]|nr:hypothetical protein [Gammaproteobacteria bacterium]